MHAAHKAPAAQDGAQGDALVGRAAGLAGDLPPLLARAWRLADAVALGEQGRRAPGQGDAFWQFRPARPGDPARAIDWRRSARSDQHFVQEKEWQLAQTVMLWADASASMQFASRDDLEPKAVRAALVALALSVLLIRGGERVGLSGLPPGRGQVQLSRLARALAGRLDKDMAATGTDYGTPGDTPVPRHARAVFLSDFLGDLAPTREAVLRLADRDVRGALVMILDPAEEAFPFQGRTIFQSMGRTLTFETRRAADLRARYQERLAARKAALAELAGESGWTHLCHHTADPAAQALLWLHHGLEVRA